MSGYFQRRKGKGYATFRIGRSTVERSSDSRLLLTRKEVKGIFNIFGRGFEGASERIENRLLTRNPVRDLSEPFEVEEVDTGHRHSTERSI